MRSLSLKDNILLRIIKGIFLNIFSITDADYSHKLIRICGIKIRILKPDNKKRISIDYSKYSDITRGFFERISISIIVYFKRNGQNL